MSERAGEVGHRPGTDATAGRSTTDDGIALYYEVRGSGPPLLLVQGGLSEAGATEQLATELAARFRVISYDRRGLSRSPAATDGTTVDMNRHARDAAGLLDELADGPAHVVGASIGALLGLHLAGSAPDRVATVIAHEPPMARVVHDPVRESGFDRVAALAEQDVWTAIAEMAGLIGGPGETEPGARPGPQVGDMGSNLRWFFRQDFPAVRASTLTADDVAAFPEPVRVVATGGVESRGGWEYRCAAALAARLGRPLVELSGGHNGLVSHPRAVAGRVVELVQT